MASRFTFASFPETGGSSSAEPFPSPFDSDIRTIREVTGDDYPSPPASRNSSLSLSNATVNELKSFIEKQVFEVKAAVDRCESKITVAAERHEAQLRAVYERQEAMMVYLKQVDDRVKHTSSNVVKTDINVTKVLQQSESRKRKNEISLITGKPYSIEEEPAYQEQVDNIAINTRDALNLVLDGIDLFEWVLKLKLARMVRDPRGFAPKVFQLILPVTVLADHFVGHLQSGKVCVPNNRDGHPKKAFSASFNLFLGRLFKAVAGNLVAPCSADLFYSQVRAGLNGLGDNIHKNNPYRVASIDYIYDGYDTQTYTPLHPFHLTVPINWIDADATAKARSKMVGNVNADGNGSNAEENGFDSGGNGFDAGGNGFDAGGNGFNTGGNGFDAGGNGFNTSGNGFDAGGTAFNTGATGCGVGRPAPM
uniref:DUF641 domain-containing protein n=1 Tax=Panagrellus redivivus TaxID=6233 RepID=A0A7E4ZQA8_PANRE